MSVFYVHIWMIQWANRIHISMLPLYIVLAQAHNIERNKNKI